MSEFDKIREKLLKPKKVKVTPTTGLSSGSTLFNLALTSNPDFAFSQGCYYLLVGASRSGKTFLALQTLAEATINRRFDKHQLIYYAPERGARMNLVKFFGKPLKDRLQFRYPVTTEDFYYGLDDDLENGPSIVILDSMDALIPAADLDHFKKGKTSRKKSKEDGEEKQKGTYGTAKAKANSGNLRVVISTKLEKTNSILIIISQTRDNIGFGAMFHPDTRGGGHALTFYATGEAWFKLKQSIKKSVRGKQRKIGTVLQAQVKKNRDTGWEPVVELHHYPSVGFDDIGSCCQFLVDENHWKETEGKITAPEFGFEKGSQEKLVRKIESEGKESELRELVAKVWHEIESDCAVERKPRYT